MEARADRRSELHEVGMLGLQLLEGFFIEFQVGLENASHLVFKLLSLVAMMQDLDGLLESDGNEKAYRDSRNVYEEIFPGVDRQVGCVDSSIGAEISGMEGTPTFGETVASEAVGGKGGDSLDRFSEASGGLSLDRPCSTWLRPTWFVHLDHCRCSPNEQEALI